MKYALFLASASLALGLLHNSNAKAEMPREGEPAPMVQLPAAYGGKEIGDKKDGQALNLQDFQGKKNVVLFFFPKAMTQGCTIESCGFRDVIDKFARLDTVVIGISTDSVDLQKQFIAKEKLNFPLLADADKQISKRFGVLNEQQGFANRVTFVIDKQGNIAKVFPKVNPRARHPEEVLKFVKEGLQK
jgi:peroxiredoxin Q/BCP